MTGTGDLDPAAGQQADAQPSPDAAQSADPKPAANGASQASDAVELARTYGGREVVAVALVVVAGTFALSVMAFRDGTAVAAAMGTVTTLIGTLVGSYFGFQAGSQGRAQDAAVAETANKTAVAAAAFVPSDRTGAFFEQVNQMSPSDRNNPDFE